MESEKGFTIKVGNDRCLNHWHHGIICNHCEKLCPTQAVKIQDHYVYHDDDTCAGCGLCLSSCPTQAFTAAQWDETTIVADVTGNQWGKVHIYCNEHKAPINPEKGNVGAIRTPACLAGLSTGLWFEVGEIASVELHLEHCNECKLSNNLSALATIVLTAAEWLEGVGIEPRFIEALQPNNEKIRKRRMAVDSGLKVTSRRELFVGLIDKAKKAANGERLRSSTHLGLRRYMPDWRRRVEDAYGTIENIPDETHAAFWPAVVIDDTCEGCGLCTSYCPTGALRLEEGALTYAQIFTSGACIDCRICELFCPNEAIHRSRQQNRLPFDVQCIRKEKGAICKCCGMQMPDVERGLCHWCKQTREAETYLLDICKDVFFSPASKEGGQSTD